MYDNSKALPRDETKNRHYLFLTGMSLSIYLEYLSHIMDVLVMVRGLRLTNIILPNGAEIVVLRRENVSLPYEYEVLTHRLYFTSCTKADK